MCPTLRAGCAAVLARLAHTLKGSSKNIGVLSVVPACQSLQSVGESGRCMEGPGLLRELEKEFARAKTELERLYGIIGAA